MRLWVLGGLVLLAVNSLSGAGWADASPVGRTYQVQYDAFVFEEVTYTYSVTVFREETRIRSITVFVDGVFVVRQVPYTVRVPYTEARQGTRTVVKAVSETGDWEFEPNGNLLGPSNEAITYHSTRGTFLSFWSALDVIDPLEIKLYFGRTYYRDGSRLRGKVLLISPKYGFHIGDVNGELVQ